MSCAIEPADAGKNSPMTNHDDQIQRIKVKIFEAKRADRRLKVFGADQHRYVLHEPTTLQAVTDFETRFGLDLTDCYKAFVLEVGNGGVGYQDSGAGPFYGIYPFGKEVDELVYQNAEEFLKKDCLLDPDMTDKTWKGLIGKSSRKSNGSSVGGTLGAGDLWAGILPIGSQGCTYLHGLVLNGPHKGRVVNIDAEKQKPKFAHEETFLDWYERWLDEVISGDLMKSTAGWFGYEKPDRK